MKRYTAGGFETICMLALFVFGFGCAHTVVDYGRREIYKVKFVRSATHDTIEPSQPNSEERLQQIIRVALVGKGFKELRGAPHIWTRGGASVGIHRDKSEDLILEIGAMGSQESVRLSEMAEQEVIGIMKQHAEVEVTLITPAKPAR